MIGNKKSPRSVALSSLMLVAVLLSFSGCEKYVDYDVKRLHFKSVSLCARFTKNGAAQAGEGTLRVLAYDVFGNYIDHSGVVSYYPDKRTCTLIPVTLVPNGKDKKRSFVYGVYVAPDGKIARSWTQDYTAEYMQAVTVEGEVNAKVSVDELVLTVDGAKIGGTIVGFEDRGDILRVDAEFDFNNPNVNPGDIVAIWQRLFMKKSQDQGKRILDRLKKSFSREQLSTGEIPTPATDAKGDSDLERAI